MKLLICCGAVLAGVVILFSSESVQPLNPLSVSNSLPIEQPVELGSVTWQRDLQVAKKQSSNTGKPILLLFQEVPG